MKTFASLILCLVQLYCSFQDSERLSGKYRIENGAPFQALNSMIVVNDSIYSREFADGRKATGTVKYWNYFVILKDDNSSQIMEFSRKEIQNKTIQFGIKETDPKKSETVSYLEVNIGLGRLIKQN